MERHLILGPKSKFLRYKTKNREERSDLERKMKILLIPGSYISIEGKRLEVSYKHEGYKNNILIIPESGTEIMMIGNGGGIPTHHFVASYKIYHHHPNTGVDLKAISNTEDISYSFIFGPRPVHVFGN